MGMVLSLLFTYLCGFDSLLGTSHPAAKHLKAGKKWIVHIYLSGLLACVKRWAKILDLLPMNSTAD